MRTETEIRQEIEALRSLTTAQLKEKYREVFGEESRSNHKQFIFRRIAWRIQANAWGGLSERARRRALEIADDADLRIRAPASEPQPPRETPSLRGSVSASAAGFSAPSPVAPCRLFREASTAPGSRSTHTHGTNATSSLRCAIPRTVSIAGVHVERNLKPLELPQDGLAVRAARIVCNGTAG